MKTFAGNKTLAAIEAQCKAAGIKCSMREFNKGSDYVYITGGGAAVLYNTFNGRFFGKTDTGVEFSSDSAKWDREPWMQALLSFFYVEKTASANGNKA